MTDIPALSSARASMVANEAVDARDYYFFFVHYPQYIIALTLYNTYN